MDDVRWKQRLAGAASAELEAEIDVFETQLRLRKDGKIEDKLFAETRLRRGAYGQRYDNGRRWDGEKDQGLAFPCGELTKGPETVWDAPGMVRIKIPFGALTATQLEVMADLAEEYSDDILHVTTRQDIQLHFIHIDDTPDLFRRLAAVGITTREACGNSVRNVTGCPIAGVCKTEAFDISPYAKALAHYLLGHPDTQDFGRKFKIAFSGCSAEACGLALMHDLGLVAVTRPGADGTIERGFEFYVGGGLGSVPHQALLLDPFVPEAELMPLTQAVCRIFARHGEKQNRSRARIKFLVKKLGIEAFRQLVLEERERIPPEARWTAWIDGVAPHDAPSFPAAPAPMLRKAGDPALQAWWQTNVRPQRQPGYAVVTVTLPLGDFTPGAINQPSFAWQGQRLAPNICYEDLFGEELAARFADAATAPTAFVNLSNIAWFGDTVAIDQHLAISRMRALEFERPVLRATNTGATAIVDAQGRVTQQLPRLTRGVLRGTFQGGTGITPYAAWAARWGLAPLWGAAALIVLAAAAAGRRGD
jgi:sulfite reductase (ferredoxin)